MHDGYQLPALPANLPDINAARLPSVYQAAKVALAECERMDECKDWADKMEALASYARQADDDALLKHCMRIKARAIDRCGEILRAVPAAVNRHQVTSGGNAPTGRMQAARDAGLSRDQAVTAIRVNKVPRDIFEAAVESDTPPTIETLASLNSETTHIIRPADDYLNGRDAADFEQGTRLMGLLDWVRKRSATLDVTAALRGLSDSELQLIAERINDTIIWFSSLKETIDGV